MILETRSDFAKRLGVNKSTITRAAQAGRLVLEGKMVNVEASLARWHATSGARSDVAARHAAQRGHDIPLASIAHLGQENAATGRFGPNTGLVAPEVAAQPGSATAGSDIESTGRARYKAIVLHFENENIKLEMALRRGIRHPAAAVERESYGLGIALRAAVERLIDQLAPRLAALRDEAERAALLRRECAVLARSMKAEFLQAARRLRQPGEKA